VFFHALDEPALQFVFVAQAFFFDAGLAFGAVSPAVLGGFVAADVDVFRGEEVDDFVDDVFEKLEGFVVACA
jgi:hypothetical protein